MRIPSDEWLERTNRDLRSRNVDARQRPFEAIGCYCTDFAVQAVPLNSVVARHIFAWFSLRLKPGELHVPPLFTGAFYYDTSFWPVDIPVIYGRVQIDPVDGLRHMPARTKSDLRSVPADLLVYTEFWADCLDFALGYGDMERRPLDPFGIDLLRNGDRELRGAVSLLLERAPNCKGGMSCRMAFEIFLKAFLVLKNGLTDKETRLFGHDLRTLVGECCRTTSFHSLLGCEPDLSAFPAISDRYTGGSVPKSSLWTCCKLAHRAAATTVRSFTGRDTRQQLLKTA